MIEMQQSKTRDIPLWVTIPLVLLALAGGAYFLYWYAFDQPPKPLRFDDRIAGEGMFRAGQRTRVVTANDGIQKLGDGSWLVRSGAGNASMHVQTSRRSQYYVSPRYTNLFTGEVRDLLVMGYRLSTDQAMREQIGIKPDQLKALRDIGPQEDMKGLTEAERTRLTDLFKAWQDSTTKKVDLLKAAAEKSGSVSKASLEEATANVAKAEKAVVAALDEVSKKHFDETKAYLQARADKVKAIVTPEQIKLFRDGSPKTPPAGRPSELIKPVTPPTTKPVADPVKPPVAAPTTKPVADPVKPPVPAPTTKPVADPVKPPVPAPTTKPVAEPAKPAAEPAKPAPAEPVKPAAPVTKPAAEPTKATLGAPIQLMPPVTKPAVDPAKPVEPAKPAVEPTKAAPAPATTKPATAPATQPAK